MGYRKIYIILFVFMTFVNISVGWSYPYCGTNSYGNKYCSYGPDCYEYWNLNGTHYYHCSSNYLTMDEKCNIKYPGTIYRRSDGMCACKGDLVGQSSWNGSCKKELSFNIKDYKKKELYEKEDLEYKKKLWDSLDNLYDEKKKKNDFPKIDWDSFNDLYSNKKNDDPFSALEKYSICQNKYGLASYYSHTDINGTIICGCVKGFKIYNETDGCVPEY